MSWVPHPAVARVRVDHGQSSSLGSGTLVATQGETGLVVTNWHVVQDPGQVTVTFPDGISRPARIVKTDRTWDLAALVIRPPSAPPVPIATTAPRPGEPLTIAGYGSGRYRAIEGRCTQYVSPGERAPYEMVELSAEARQGDSGGPILNAQGQLAGVLFGAGSGTTSGSYCGRVREFLDSVWVSAAGLPTPPAEASPQHLAQQFAQPLGNSSLAEREGLQPQFELARNAAATGWQTAGGPPSARSSRVVPPEDGPWYRFDYAPTPGRASSLAASPHAASAAGAGPGGERSGSQFATTPLTHAVPPAAERTTAGRPDAGPAATGPSELGLPGETRSAADQTLQLTWSDVAGDTLFEQIKTSLALLGLATLVVGLLGRLAG